MRSLQWYKRGAAYTSTNPNTEITSDTFNDGTLIITRSSNGSAF
jgi:flavodoxin